MVSFSFSWRGRCHIGVGNTETPHYTGANHCCKGAMLLTQGRKSEAELRYPIGVRGALLLLRSRQRQPARNAAHSAAGRRCRVFRASQYALANTTRPWRGCPQTMQGPASPRSVTAAVAPFQRQRCCVIQPGLVRPGRAMRLPAFPAMIRPGLPQDGAHRAQESNAESVA